MDKCRSVTKKGEGCRNKSIPFSKYCLIHQDLSSWLIGAFIGIIVALLIAFYQNREPNLAVRFFLDESADPSKINCEIINSGREEARNIILSFNNLMPLETKVFANPELGLSLNASDSIPNPQKHPELAKVTTAFIVKIPRVSAGDKMIFTIATTNSDNLRAAKQVVKIRNRIREVLEEFYDKLQKAHPEETVNLAVEDILSGRLKDEDFYKPDKYSYEKGRFAVSFISQREQFAAAINQDLYARYKKEFIDVFRCRSNFKAPVLRILTSGGETTFAIMPPYVETYVDFTVPISELKEKGVMWVQPPVPGSYD
jgi:gas vesicle protein